MSVANIVSALKGVFASHNAASASLDMGGKPQILSADWDQFSRKYAMVRYAAHATDSTTGEFSLFTCRAASGIVVTKFSVLSEGAVTSSDTNYGTVALNQRTAGATAVVVGSLTTKTTAGSGTGDWAANKAYAGSVTAGITIANGDTLTIQDSKAAGGVTLPARQVQLEYYEL